MKKEVLIERIKSWVELESPSSDTEQLLKMMKLAEQQAKHIGLHTTIVMLDNNRPLLYATNREEHNQEEKGILLLSHLDTVHPVGTLQKNPFRIEGDKCYGPGIYDMKAGAQLALSALEGVLSELKIPVDFLFSPDEETGSHASREMIEMYAKKAKCVLVTEPARANTGFCVTERKGTGMCTIKAHGVPAHAGVQHAKGRNAIKEMAKVILAVEAQTNYERGITFNVGEIRGGTTINVVPSYCEISIDFRLPDDAAVQEVKDFFAQIKSSDPDIRLEIDVEINRPPMFKTEAAAELLRDAQKAAQDAGWELGEAPQTGGGSDANFTAGVGTPSLDGIGPDGDGAHTLQEHILVSTLEQRYQFWVNLLRLLDKKYAAS